MTDKVNGRLSKPCILTEAHEREGAGMVVVHKALARIENEQARYGQRLDLIETKLNAQLQIVADNTTSMSHSLELIQQANSKLIDVISNRNSVPSTVMMLVMLLMAGIFLARELALTGGRASVNMSGVEISTGNNGQGAARK